MKPRKVHISGDAWPYSVTHTRVNIWNPVSGRAYSPRKREIGVQDSEERIAIKPSEVKAWIIENVIKGNK